MMDFSVSSSILFVSSLFLGRLKQCCLVLILPLCSEELPDEYKLLLADPGDKPITARNLLKWRRCPDSIPVISPSHFLWLRKGARSISFMPWEGPNERMNRFSIQQAIFVCDGAHRLGWQVVWRGKAEKKKEMWVPPQNERQKGSFEMMKMSLLTQRPNCNHKFF